ncbi:MAG: Gfo/Idh/MocA family oxidoreductase [Candidatus Bathyarchaeia archaeon]
MEKFGAAVHGAGWVATQHVKAYINNPHTEVVAISSRRESSAKNLANMYGLKEVKIYTDYDKLLDDPEVDIISICTPQHLHSEETVKAAEAKKHILIEKPVAIDLEGLKAMRDAVRKARVKTVVSFVLRWNPCIETVKSMIADDFLGDVYYVETDYQSHISDWWSGWDWARRKDIGVSSFLVAGVHALDMARWFAEKDRFKASNVVEVVAYADGWRKGLGEKPMEYDGLEVMLVRFENGVLGKVTSNYDVIMPYNFVWSVFGNKGTVKNNRVWSKKFPGQNDWVEIPAIMPDTAEVGHHPFQAEIDHFVDCILSDRESHCNLEDAVNTHEAALAAIISEKEDNRKVKLPLIK